MAINYNVTGTEQNRLADYISGFMGTEKKYLSAPTFAYQIGYLTAIKQRHTIRCGATSIFLLS